MTQLETFDSLRDSIIYLFENRTYGVNIVF